MRWALQNADARKRQVPGKAGERPTSGGEISRYERWIWDMREKMMRFMSGRYGTDDYSKFLLGAAVALMVVNLFTRISILNFLVFALLIYVYVRLFSKNIQKRYAENMKYLELKNKFFGFFRKENGWQRTEKSIIFTAVPTANRKSAFRKGKERYALPARNAGLNLPRKAEKSYVWICMH